MGGHKLQEVKSWSPVVERRLFKKLLEHKPAGVSKRFHMVCLTQLINEIYDDEDVDFEELLCEQDAARVRTTRQTRLASRSSLPTDVSVSPLPPQPPKSYPPKYRFRATPKDIWKKLNELYDMELIEENEYIPDEFVKQSDFFLPDGEFSELLKAKEEEAASRLQTPQRALPPPANNRWNIRRKRRDSGETHSRSSRSSTPSWSRDIRRS